MFNLRFLQFLNSNTYLAIQKMNFLSWKNRVKVPINILDHFSEQIIDFDQSKLTLEGQNDE